MYLYRSYSTHNTRHAYLGTRWRCVCEIFIILQRTSDPSRVSTIDIAIRWPCVKWPKIFMSMLLVRANIYRNDRFGETNQTRDNQSIFDLMFSIVRFIIPCLKKPIRTFKTFSLYRVFFWNVLFS